MEGAFGWPGIAALPLNKCAMQIASFRPVHHSVSVLSLSLSFFLSFCLYRVRKIDGKRKVGKEFILMNNFRTQVSLAKQIS